MVRSDTLRRTTLRLAAASLLSAVAAPASASFLSGEALDTFADWLALFVIFVVPIGAIVVFWLVHVLPEKIAEKRHHPQKDAIHTLCLLSLVFGGLLWPLAWLWAYTKPIGYKLAYGTEKHDDFYEQAGEKAKAGDLLAHEIDHLRDELDAMAARGALPPKLRALRDDLGALGAPTARAAPGPARGEAA
jgi:hypothetical protein